ncbi:hypothetical protein HDV00_003955 [Rhizophlyctis rosea]|nr:hypothetical protein HDV00_003955 [Rhizophlyctis rosea]
MPKKKSSRPATAITSIAAVMVPPTPPTTTQSSTPPTTTPPSASDVPPPTSAPADVTSPTENVEEQEEAQQETGLRGQANKDMRAVTGYFEDREMVDENKIGKAMSFLTNVGKSQKSQVSARDKELAKIVISKEDVELVMNQLEITKPQAERALRENKGNAVETLRKLISV